MKKHWHQFILWRFLQIISPNRCFRWYWHLYMKPHMDRAIEAGVHFTYVFLLANKAIDDADFIFIFPDDLLRPELDKAISELAL